MAGRIYLLNDNSELTPMDEALYDSERLLQEMLAKHPDLLAGEQINIDDPRRWLLVTREMSVPDEEDGSGRWSIDHLFLDQEGIPTLVEVKRSSDTRIRREVVGQMLDYASNAVVYWPVEKIQTTFESRCVSEKKDPSVELAALLREEHDPAAFWQQVKTNLQAGRIRMVFVADEIPSELRRIIEFLNRHLDPTEVLGVEIKQFIGKGVKTLVPRVIGLIGTGGTETPRTITEMAFLSEVNSSLPKNESECVRSLIRWSRERGLELNFTKGNRGSFNPSIRLGDTLIQPFSVRKTGMLVILLRWLKTRPPFDDEVRRSELLSKLQQLPGFQGTELARDGFPSIPLAQLVEENVFKKALEIFDWIVSEIRAEGTPTT